MKGFPNQVANLQTLASALRVMIDLKAEVRNPKQDDVFGTALVRRGVLGTGHREVPVEEYLNRQLAQPLSNQGFRVRARGLRELFRMLNLIDDSGPNVEVTQYGDQVASLAEPFLDDEALRVWRTLLIEMTLRGADGETSHPYRVLLALVDRKPGISRSKCALALEARNDSEEELGRIADLADLEEDEIVDRLGVTRATWDNAKKILPSFAEQLGDVEKVGRRYFLPPSTDPLEDETDEATVRPAARARRPRGPSNVTSEAIARSGTTDENWNDLEEPIGTPVDAETLKLRAAKLMDRLRRHNLIVQEISRTLEEEGAKLFEFPFDVLARFGERVLLVEVKTLDGTEADEVARVRDALAQLLYYESFDTESLAQGREVVKVACFERKISDEHIAWLEASDICVVWSNGVGGFEGSSKGQATLRDHLNLRGL